MATNHQSPTTDHQIIAGRRTTSVPRMRIMSAPRRRSVRWIQQRLRSFPFAFAGIGHLLRTQGNAQIHVAAGSVAIALGFLFNIDRGEWLALALTITLVLAAEGVNTAVEAVVDLVTPGFHPLAKIAKDVAAGTVLLTAIGAVAVGLIVFLPRLWALIAPWLNGAT
ncbi:MAG: diacylglycerol kinase family protein [Roseiflexus sp.]|nr:diacylglycerol kinase family protein [Roseiflexus sp.]MCS7287796.1 diacylglycerol kinase family protein [Roseiflexus sp.]MDW8145689.1 diacylglycerol kinase family protein [Roseiflexaceae bacterium]MDW8232130.1 diacylglycerol kinase family protein [Roseiflexaceae bacterium]